MRGTVTCRPTVAYIVHVDGINAAFDTDGGPRPPEIMSATRTFVSSVLIHEGHEFLKSKSIITI